MRTSQSWLRRPALCSATPCQPSCPLQVHFDSFPQVWQGSARRPGSCFLWVWVMRPSTSGTGWLSLGKMVVLKVMVVSNLSSRLLSCWLFSQALWSYTVRKNSKLWVECIWTAEICLSLQGCSPSSPSSSGSGSQPGLWGCGLPHTALEPGGL